MKIPFVDLKAQYLSIKDELDQVINTVIMDSSFIGGIHLKTFESNFASYIGTKHCIGVGNATDALCISLKAFGLKEGDEVITVANSFIATSEAITATGAKVVFVDCDEKTFNIDANRIESAISKRTKAVIPVHLYGQPAAMNTVMDIARRHNLLVVEDAAQAHGARFNGKKVGTLGDCACFSFFPGKNLGAYGDGGAIVTNNDEFARNARMLANHGRIEKYDHEFEGRNSRLDGLQAAILDVKLKHLEKWTDRRKAVARMYDEGLHSTVVTPSVLPNVQHVYHLYVVRVKDRDEVRKQLDERGVSTGVHYPIPLPFLKAYEYLKHRPGDFPVSHLLKDEILSLPIHGSITDEQVQYVIEQLKDVVRK